MTGEVTSRNPGGALEAERTLKRINEEWVDALVRGDTATLSELMDESCIFSYALEGDDRAQFISDIESGALKVDSLSRDNVEIRIYGSTGVMIALDTSNWHYKGRYIEGYYRVIHVYAERDGVWKIVAIQASPISMK
jgi:ketosteroid isomerase-like protein